MKKKYQVCTIIAAFTMLVSIITMSAVSVSAEQHGSIALEYNYTGPAENGGTQEDTTQGSNTPGAGQPNHSQTNVKTGDATAIIAGGLSFAAIISAGTAWFAIMMKKKAD